MTSWSPSEPAGADVTGAVQFEGRTAEEAVARARAALGPSSDVRCWKTRRGGVAGFFATEIFVASLTPPPGSETTAAAPRGFARGSKGRRGAPAPSTPGATAFRAPGHPVDAGGEPPAESDVASGWEPGSGPPVSPADPLTGLVEATRDEVTLRSVSIPPEAFDEVLAEAEAALARQPEGGGSTGLPAPVPPTPATPVTAEVGPAAAELTAPEEKLPAPEARGIAPTGPGDKGERSTPASKAEKATRTRPTSKAARRTPVPPRSRTAQAGRERGAPHLPDLRAPLLALGLADAYVPRGQRPSLDALARAMARLPVAPPLPAADGAVVAVIGSSPHLDLTIDLVATELSLGPRDVLRLDDGSRLRRQIARRRSSGRASLVAVDAGPGAPSERPSMLLEQSAPDYVVAAVGARCKRVDVEDWVRDLVSVDAVALWDLAVTRTPAELLGALPIAYVDGEPSSPLGWTLLLAGRAKNRRR